MTDDTTTRLHEATLTLLHKTGVRIESDAALDLLQSGGVRVDLARRRVYPSARDVEWALGQAPRRFSVFGRHADRPFVLGGADVYVVSGGASVRVLTLDGRYETATWGHLRQFNRLLDALPNIHFLLNQVDPSPCDNRGLLQGDPPAGYYKRLAAEMFIGSPKPCWLQADGADDVAAMVAMGAVLRGSRQALADRPLFLTGSNAEPPLCVPRQAADILVAASQAGVPCGIGDYVMAGITAPVTTAGALAQRNAVQLTVLVLSQLARPGAPFYYAAQSGGADMRTLNPLTANPQAVRLMRTAIEMGRHYGLPVLGLACTDARLADAQAACERAILFQSALDAGAHVIQGPTSMMDQMMLSSFVQAVIDDEIVGYLLAARGRVDVSDETLALDVIDQVIHDESPGGLKFASHPHTARHMRDELWRPQLFNYDAFAAWQRAGGHTLLERAEARAREILEEHQPEPLGEDMVQEIRHIAGEQANDQTH
jgi:trimethylamine--corrinoid protein Co-methyltransferase